ncbi:MAG: hypothetical protein GY776_09940 [Alteromonas sp.]|nr:hypothetical protein [Alteromonas sp.]
MSGMITAAVVVAGGTAYASHKAGKAQEKAAAAQAASIEKAYGISSDAAAKARADALSLFNPAFSDISTSLNQARGDLLAGRASAQNVLNDAFLQSSNTLQTSGQQAMSAILGIQPPPQQMVPPQQRPQNQQPPRAGQPPQAGQPPKITDRWSPDWSPDMPSKAAPSLRGAAQQQPFDPNASGLRQQPMTQQPMAQRPFDINQVATEQVNPQQAPTQQVSLRGQAPQDLQLQQQDLNSMFRFNPAQRY